MGFPSPVGMAGNLAAADYTAKAALLLPLSNLTVPHLDYKSLIPSEALKQWQIGILSLRTSCMRLNQG